MDRGFDLRFVRILNVPGVSGQDAELQILQIDDLSR